MTSEVLLTKIEDLNLKNRELIKKIHQIEALINRGYDLIRKNLSINEQNSLFFNHGIGGIKRKLLEETKIKKQENLRERLYSVIRHDKSLRYPHRKIMECLIENYDYERQEFKEMNFSRIVNEAGLGKNKAKEYFQSLIEKGLIECHTDGYRKFYRLKLNADGH